MSSSKVRWLVGALLLVPIVFPLLVFTYARSEPEFLGFPFYYWYQLLWILIGAIFTAVAYFLVTREERRNRLNRRIGQEDKSP